MPRHGVYCALGSMGEITVAQQFKTGDIVQLKSGGPKMTVREPSSSREGVIYCQWFAGSKLENGAFPMDSLEPASVEKK